MTSNGVSGQYLQPTLHYVMFYPEGSSSSYSLSLKSYMCQWPSLDYIVRSNHSNIFKLIQRTLRHNNDRDENLCRREHFTLE